MTKAILLDFWGTLVENGVFPSPVRNVKAILNIRLPFAMYITRFEKAFMTKKFDSLKDAFNAVAIEFGITIDDETMDRLIGLWNKNMLLSKPFPETIKTLEKLKENYKLFLIVNTDQFSIPPTLKKFDMDKYFDKTFFSYDYGLLKTDVELFKTVLKKAKLKKEDVVMVGDSIESDINAAIKADIKAILVDRRRSRDYTPNVATLDEVEKHLG